VTTTTILAAASINNGLMVAPRPDSGSPVASSVLAASPPARHYTAADIPSGFYAQASSVINEHGIRLISDFEGPPRLKARLCEGGRFELGRGITFHFDGRPVLEGETCDEAYAEALFVNALGVFARAVDELVTFPINSNQRSALTAISYNIGIENLRTSTVLRETNAGRFDDAAAAFGMWVYATKNNYKQAYRGLLRRQYATACLYLGYDWTEACEDDAIALKREPPASLPGRDRVIYKTPFKDVLAVAQRYPLTEPADAILFEPAPTPAAGAKPAQAAIPDSRNSSSEDELVLNQPAAPATGPAAGMPEPKPNPAPASPAPKTSPSAGTSSPPAIPAAAGGSNLPPQPVPLPKPKEPEKPVAAPPLPKDAAPSSIEPKDMVLSKRFWGLAITAAGTTNFLPRGVNEWINNEGNRELLTWLAVVAIGIILYKIGQAKATRPLK